MTYGRILLLAVLLPAVCAGLNPRKRLSQYTHRHWTQAHGLPQDTVRAVAQTKDGFLWVGTDEGLARFDGYEFIGAGRNELPSAAIQSLCSGSDGTLWIGTTNGIATYKDGRFMVPSEPALRGVAVSSIAQGADGAIWFSAGMHLVKWKSGAYAVFGPDNGLGIAGVRTVLPVGEEAWVGGYGAIGRFVRNRLSDLQSTERIGIGVPIALAQNGESLVAGGTLGLAARDSGGTWHTIDVENKFVRALLLDRDGGLWVGTNDGLLRARPRLPFERFLTQWVWCVFEDRDGSVWIGTNDGLHQLVDQPLAVFSTPEGLPSGEPTGVAQDGSGRIWIGFQNAGAGYIEGDRFRPVRLPNAQVLALRTARNGEVLAGTRAGLFRLRTSGVTRVYEPRDTLRRRNVFDVAEGAPPVLWLGTNAGLLRVEDSKVSNPVPGGPLLDDAVVAVAVTADGSVWAGTYGRGLWQLTADGKRHFMMADGLPSNQIRSLREDGRGTLWIGTFGGGLALYSSGKLRVLSSQNGLPSDNIGTVVKDRGGALWAGTTRGLVSVSRTDLDSVLAGDSKVVRARLLGVGDGLRSSNAAPGYPSSSGGILAHDGALWFPTANGVARVYPERAVPIHRSTPPVLTEVIGDGDRLDITRPLELPPDVRRLEFRYTAVHLAAPEAVRYRVRLGPVDGDWIELGHRRVVAYSNLKPGAYTFSVSTTAGPDSSPGDPTTLRFRKRPHVYETMWFRVGLALAAAGAIVLLFRASLARERRTYAAVLEERSRIAREIHDTLAQGFVGIASQLEAVRMMFRSNPDAAERQLALAQRMSQHSLTEARRSITDLRAATLGHSDVAAAIRATVLQQLAGSTVRAEFSLETDSVRDVPKHLAHHIIRIVQEAVANAIKHGAANTVHVGMARAGDRLRVRVVDDGRGFDPSGAFASAGAHFGLLGMRERAQHAGGELHLQSAPGSGTTIEVLLPYK